MSGIAQPPAHSDGVDGDPPLQWIGEVVAESVAPAADLAGDSLPTGNGPLPGERTARRCRCQEGMVSVDLDPDLAAFAVRLLVCDALHGWGPIRMEVDCVDRTDRGS